MLSWPPASIAAFHSSKAARLSSGSSSRSLRVWLPYQVPESVTADKPAHFA